MPTVVGVKMRPVGRVLTFEADDPEIETGDRVVVTTERGEEIGEVVKGPESIDPSQVEGSLKPVVRIATDSDVQRAAELREREAEAMQTYRRLVSEHGLDMKPVGVEYLFDGRKIVFYFSAEERVDFRALVRDLAREFKSRIDMRQIGVRDEARMVGGLGHCGQRLCCERFGGEFQPVSIRMAKAQDLPLNPLKISGLCGRLMCCLRYEYDAYKEFKSRAPKSGATVGTPRGDAKVVALDAPRETVTLATSEGRITIPLSAMETEGCPGPRPCRVCEDAFKQVEAEQLEALSSTLMGPRAASPKTEKAASSEAKPKSRRRKRRRPKGEAKGQSQGQGGAKKRETPGARQKTGSQKKSSGETKTSGSDQGRGPERKKTTRRRRRRRPSGGGTEKSTGS